MKLLVLVVAALVSNAYAGCCKGKTARLVQEQWDSIWTAEKSHNKVQIAAAVFADLFAANPETKALFKRVNVDNPESPEFRAHSVRIMGGLDVAVNLLQDKPALDAQLAQLSKQHQAREGVVSAQFDAIAASFRNVLPNAIPAFDSDAWDTCFDVIKAGITYGLP